MVNLEHKLTVDDLIVEYMISKLKLGYEPSYTTEEFITFLYYFESKSKENVYDALYDNQRLFDRFFHRKKQDWQFEPHMKKVDKNLIFPTYKFSDYDRSVINTYFMPKNRQEEIRKVITDYLSDMPKRKINCNEQFNDNNLKIGQKISAIIVNSIWNGYLKQNMKYNRWPEQCRDIEKYLLNLDLASIIELPSIRKEVLNFYYETSKKIAYLAQNDPNLKMNNYENPYLAYSNYKIVTQGYEKLLKKTDSSFNIDLENNQFVESYEGNGFTLYGEDDDIITNKINLDNQKVKKLVHSLNNINK